MGGKQGEGQRQTDIETKEKTTIRTSEPRFKGLVTSSRAFLKYMCSPDY